MTRQYLRACTLSLSDTSGSPAGLVVKGGGPTDLRVAFEIESHTLQSPDVAQFTLFNVASSTAVKVQQEFKELVFTAGYQDNEGEIYRGSIVETQYGEKVDNFTTTLLRIWCANSDLAYRAPVSKTLAAGSTHQNIVDTCLAAMQAAQPGFTMGPVVGVNLSSFQFPRGLALAGMARDFLRDVCLSNGANFTLTGNKLTIIGKNASGTGSSGVVLSPASGMIRQPIQRPEGVIVECLINPAIQLNTTVKIDSSIVSPSINGSPVLPNLTDQQTQLSNQLNANSEYRVLHILTTGDTRGDDWSMKLTTIGVGQNVNTTQAGLGYS